MEVSHVSCLTDPLHEIHEVPFGKQVVKGPEDYDVKQWKGNAELFAALVEVQLIEGRFAMERI